MAKEYTLTKEQYDKVKHLIEVEDSKYESLQDFIGQGVFIRTVTNYYTGRVSKIIGKFIKLEECAWVADTGRLTEFMKGSPTSALETEVMGTTLINIDSIIDLSPYSNMFSKQQ